jgi:hypothetical protein
MFGKDFESRHGVASESRKTELLALNVDPRTCLLRGKAEEMSAASDDEIEWGKSFAGQAYVHAGKGSRGYSMYYSGGQPDLR